MKQKSNGLPKKTKYSKLDKFQLIKKTKRKSYIIKKLKALIEVNSLINSSLNKDIVLKNILDHTKAIMNCTKSSILLVEPESNELKFAVLTNEEEQKQLKDIRLKMGEGIAGTVWRQGTPLLIRDATKDRRFSAKADKKTEYRTTSIVAVPLVVNGKIIGVMEAINKLNLSPFNRFDMEIMQNLALQAAVAIENAKLYELAITDGLTRLFIHRYFQKRLEEEMNRSFRYGSDLSIVMADIDFFKRLNDNYGHLAGDEILIRTAELIKKNCRSSDIACRYGGEELSIILPEADLKGAVFFADKLRSIIEKMVVNFLERELRITISLGVASLKEDQPKSKADFISMADQALYHSKNSGRNKVTAFNAIK
ncbi:MAG: sensor domain-containing diguanylate cyclase [Spirochaetes bacterium]|nr:sensor domain-containing diguanylate cyclase [Spirochaetota bacterium]